MFQTVRSPNTCTSTSWDMTSNRSLVSHTVPSGSTESNFSKSIQVGTVILDISVSLWDLGYTGLDVALSLWWIPSLSFLPHPHFQGIQRSEFDCLHTRSIIMTKKCRKQSHLSIREQQVMTGQLWEIIHKFYLSPSFQALTTSSGMIADFLYDFRRWGSGSDCRMKYMSRE